MAKSSWGAVLWPSSIMEEAIADTPSALHSINILDYQIRGVCGVGWASGLSEKHNRKTTSNISIFNSR